ncbi:GNAT family N-acetyltransferase [Microbacterium gorillae]|uniref:GNAT family N-acetyltransferase n=1 Tax=Microbacterium gorillae TaxID=1231063 RepID=UPI00058FB85C|nr:GNAT family N-acetyltransferase [Microbacterium gorillae]
MSTLSLRPANPTDGLFLAEMLVAAANWHPRSPRPRHEVLAHPAYRRYLTGWMRPGDSGVVAEWADAPIGAAWFRAASGSRVPDLVIGVRAPYRAQGVGRALLQDLCHTARAAGHGRLSLNVHEDNPAVVLYRSEGFVWERGADGHDTMVRRLG